MFLDPDMSKKVSAILALRGIIIMPILTISAPHRRDRGADTVVGTRPEVELIPASFT